MLLPWLQHIIIIDLTDIGIVGLFVTNGVLGILWYILLGISIYKYIRYLKDKRHGNVFVPLCYLIFSLVTCFTLLPFYYNPEYLVISYILLERCDKCE